MAALAGQVEAERAIAAALAQELEVERATVAALAQELMAERASTAALAVQDEVHDDNDKEEHTDAPETVERAFVAAPLDQEEVEHDPLHASVHDSPVEHADEKQCPLCQVALTYKNKAQCFMCNMVYCNECCWRGFCQPCEEIGHYEGSLDGGSFDFLAMEPPVEQVHE